MRHQQRVQNLNSLKIRGDTEDVPLEDYSAFSDDVEIYFRHLEHHLLRHIREADIVIGCVAWLTNFKILHALASKATAIIVQKEDFLRPDIDSNPTTWITKLQEAYSQLDNPWGRYEFGFLLHKLSVNNGTSIDAVRCVGNHNSHKKIASPKMHNKFLIFGRYVDIPWEQEGTQEWEKETIQAGIRPRNKTTRCIRFQGTWTGSFNLTKNATYSFENAVYLKRPDVALRYYKEWEQIYALSEPLDWESKWVTPELRIGT
jgi:hypothetical protein